MLEVQTVTESLPVRSVPPQAAASATRPYDIVFCSREAADRPALEAFIQAGFRRKHGAAVRNFMPVLVGLRDGSGDIVGAAGYRPAALERLYLEQYIGEPVEDVIRRRYPMDTTLRGDVAEIGNFACRDCQTAMVMVEVLAEFLLDQRHRWTVFTATRTVRSIMRHLGIRLSELGRADKSRVVITGDDWGSYYATDPRVMLGYVPSYRGAQDLAWSI